MPDHNIESIDIPRYQGGSLEVTKAKSPKWKGHYWVSERGRRIHHALIIGKCAQVSEVEARRKLKEHIDALDKKSRIVNVLRSPSKAQAIIGGIVDKIHPQDKGAFGELMVSVDLMARGFEVFRAMSGSASCDLIALGDSGVLRVQVKFTSCQRRLRVRHGTFDVLAEVKPDGSVLYRSDARSAVSMEISAIQSSRKSVGA